MVRPSLAIGIALAILVAALHGLSNGQQSDYWTIEQVEEVLEQTLPVKISAELSALSNGERAAVAKLLEVGDVMHQLYLGQRHESALAARSQIDGLEEPVRSQVGRLFHLYKGPIATTLDNQRVQFMPVSDERPTMNMYPKEATKEALDAICAEDKLARMQLLGLRTLVRSVTDENVKRDREALSNYPALEVLHPEFAKQVSGELKHDFYAVPYAVAYAKQLMKANRLLNEAAADVEGDDPEFARYLRHRARDFLSSDYEAGDAAWVTGKFKNLNCQIGSYETYDDKLYGVKAFYSLSLLVRDIERSRELASAIEGIQDIENALPYDAHKRIREDIPVGVYNVVADFGQARGTNTATILPNEALHTRRYGRTILLRSNIMNHPDLFRLAQQKYSAAVAPRFRSDLTIAGGFQRTLWHEIGHYLGVDRTEDGRDLGEALEKYSDTFEEMKADLVSLFSAKLLHERGIHSEEALRSIYAGGILRVLQTNKPRRTQPYQTMQLMQWNYFMQKGLLDFDVEKAELSINYDQYHEVVTKLLRRVLQIQRDGNFKNAEAFVEKYAVWDESLHEQIAEKVRGSLTHRFRYVNYEALPNLPRFP